MDSPVKRLRSPHPVCALFELRFVFRPPAGKPLVWERDIVPVAASKVFKVRGSDARELGVGFKEGWPGIGGRRARGGTAGSASFAHDARKWPYGRCSVARPSAESCIAILSSALT